MKKTKKSIAATALAISLILIFSVMASAADRILVRAYVDSNTYTNIASLQKTAYSEYADWRIDAIYKQDGSSSNYQAVNAKATNFTTPQVAYRGETTHLYIPISYRSAGHWITLFAMGRNPSLDCMISGFYNAY